METKLDSYKIEEINRIKEQVAELRASHNSIKEKIAEFSAMNNNHFDKILKEIEKVQKTMEGINHLTLKTTMQEKTMSDHEKDIAILKIKLDEAESCIEKQNTSFEIHKAKQKSALKTLSVVFLVLNALLVLGSRFIHF